MTSTRRSGDHPTAPLRLLLLADTHLPKRARDLPAEVWAEVDRADVVLHAGDWVDMTTLDRLEQRSGRLERWCPRLLEVASNPMRSPAVSTGQRNTSPVVDG